MSTRTLSDEESELLAQIRAVILKSPRHELNSHTIAETVRLVSAALHPRDGLAAAVGPLCSTADLSDWLGVSRQAINKAIKEGRILAVRTGRGDWRYPTWQLDNAGGLVANLAATVQRFHGRIDATTAAAWFIIENHDLDNLTPAAWLHQQRAITRLLKAIENFLASQPQR